ncbi:MAG: organomercurial lyase [Chloroflexi bacterium]|nr:organomercurial lyase [Chloroflexota bacterium]
MRSGRPVPAEEIGTIAGVPLSGITPMLDELAGAGWIDRDREGRVTGSGGLSLTEGPHRLAIGGQAFRNWCAYDSLGIAAALDADAVIETTCPVCGGPVRVATVGGEPPTERPERLWLADGGTDLRADFCAPTVILCSPEHADVWAGRQGGRGRVIDLAEGASLGREAWAGCARAVARVAGAA